MHSPSTPSLSQSVPVCYYKGSSVCVVDRKNTPSVVPRGGVCIDVKQMFTFFGHYCSVETNSRNMYCSNRGNFLSTCFESIAVEGPRGACSYDCFTSSI